MLTDVRRQQILAILKERRQISVEGLAQDLRVSQSSVRRYLRELQEDGRVDRRHGGASYRPVPVAEPVPQEDRLDDALFEELVREVTGFLSASRNLFLAGGPVVTAVAGRLAGKVIATHDLRIATAAAGRDNEITLVGREVDNRTLTLRSPSFDGELEAFYFEAVVLEADGLDERFLWFGRKNHLPALLGRTDSLVAIAKSTVLGHKGDWVAAPVERADVLILDRGAPEGERELLEKRCAEVRIAGTGPFAYGHDRVGNLYLMTRQGDRFGAPGGSARG